jgi:hypothetical protein
MDLLLPAACMRWQVGTSAAKAVQLAALNAGLKACSTLYQASQPNPTVRPSRGHAVRLSYIGHSPVSQKQVPPLRLLRFAPVGMTMGLHRFYFAS